MSLNALGREQTAWRYDKRYRRRIGVARTLFEEYAAALEIDLGYQGFADELADLPGCYAPPRGRLLVAWIGNEATGCVAVRPLADDVCEMKRLYVRPKFRGGGVGKLLAEAIIVEAREIGYAVMRLDTVPELAAAMWMYEVLGFLRRDAYYETPVVEDDFYGAGSTTVKSEIMAAPSLRTFAAERTW